MGARVHLDEAGWEGARGSDPWRQLSCEEEEGLTMYVGGGVVLLILIIIVVLLLVRRV